jgi:hypothetical protein
LRSAYQLALAEKRFSQASNIAAQLAEDRGALDLLDLGASAAAVNGDWATAALGDNGALLNMSLGGTEPYGSAWAWGIAYCFGHKDTLPNGILPEAVKAMIHRPAGARSQATVELIAYPNPAADRAMITLPSGIKEASLEVFDAIGRSVQILPVHGAQAFVEVDVRSWNAGLYLVRLMVNGASVAETKLTIER